MYRITPIMDVYLGGGHELFINCTPFYIITNKKEIVENYIKNNYKNIIDYICKEISINDYWEEIKNVENRNE